MTDSYLWIKVKSIDKINYDGFVYNLDVEEDHTYTANNIVNHNCHYCFHVDIDDEGRMTLLLNQRSCDFPVGVPANIQFYSALCYMLAQQTGYKPYRFIHHTEDSHIYVDQIEQVEEYLGREERTCPTLNVKHAQDIFSYTMDHFEIVGYDPQPHIKIPVAV
jgi:thymidylate synthase